MPPGRPWPGTIAKDNESKPYKFWYAQSDFTAASFIASALADPDKEDFCGLSATDVKSVCVFHAMPGHCFT